MADQSTFLEEILKALPRHSTRSAYSTLGQKLGPTGAIVGAMIDIFSGNQRTREVKDVTQSVALLNDYAGRGIDFGTFRVIPTSEFRSQNDDRFRVNTAPEGVFRSRGRGKDSSLRGFDFGTFRAIPGGLKTPGERRAEAEEERKKKKDEEDRERSRGRKKIEEIETPQSSNVYSFWYDDEEGSLYVSYKASGNVGRVRGTSICSGVEYSYGFRSHRRGPTWKYGNKQSPVPRSLYEEMIAARSKGQFVWDKILVCGEFGSHQWVAERDDSAAIRLVNAAVGGSTYVPVDGESGFRVEI